MHILDSSLSLFKTFLGCGVLFLWSCAHIVSPTGGPQDVAPPKALKMSPENYTTNFKADKIAITFDEFVQLKSPDDQLIISPPLEKTPDIKIKGKSIQITLKEQLKENTTYTINFGNSIADVNENNALENFQYVLSTGALIDSLSVVGKVLNAQTTVPEKKVWVMLYEDFADSVPYKKRPLYLSKTNDNGTFKISNLKNTNLKLFALKDENSNYLFDQTNEKIAFLNTTVDPMKKDSLILHLFENEKKEQRLLKSAAVGYGKVVFIFAKPNQPFAIGLLGASAKKPWELIEQSKNQDTLIYWYTEPSSDSLRFVLSDQKGPADTAEIRLDLKEKKPALKATSSLSNSQIHPHANLRLIFNNPVKSYDKNKIVLLEDSMPKTDFTLYQDSLYMRQYHLRYKWKESASYKLVLPKGCIVDIFDSVNDSLVYSFSPKPLEDYGKLMLRIKVQEASFNYIVHLMDEKEHVLKERFIKSDQSLSFENIEPGNYKVRVLFDNNGNGRWDTGSYSEKRQPETILYYNETIVVRANWDMEIDWSIK